MLFDYHGYLFEGGIPCSFSKTIDRTLNLSGAVDDARYGICRGKAKIVVAMAGNDRLIDVWNMVYQKSDFFTILVRQAVSRRIRDINGGRSGSYYRFNYTRQKIIIGSAGIFGIKFNIISIFSCPFYGLNGPFQDFFPG